MTGSAAPCLFTSGRVHQRNVFTLLAARLDIASFDVMDGIVLGFGPTQSSLTTRAGARAVRIVVIVVVEIAIGVQVVHVVGVVRVRGEAGKNTGYTQI